MGEHIRSLWRSLTEVGVDCAIVDVHGPRGPIDPDIQGELSDAIVRDCGAGINIYCINGDEIESVLGLLQDRTAMADGSYNIIYPAWELESFPEEWARRVDQFDEVWGESAFVQASIARSVHIPVIHLPLAAGIRRRGLFSRRYFDLSESAYLFFFAFDFLSYFERKNPMAVIEAFSEVVRSRPYADIRLVVKTNNGDQRPDMLARFNQAIAPIRHQITVIDRTLSALEMRALAWQIDCLVSLHRSEGYGFGLAEAMCLGKPVIATGYSGNMDYCTTQTAYPVPYRMIPVAEGDYPHWEGQSWADPDMSAAARQMMDLIDAPHLGVDTGRRAQAHMQTHFSYLACGLRYADRIEDIRSMPPQSLKCSPASES